jgi:hypothetical protein
MPPVIPFIPAILTAASTGLGIYDATKKPNTPNPTPVTTIPGSPTSIIGTGGTPGASASGTSPFLDQILTGKGATGTTPTGASSGVATGVGGGGAKSAAPPAAIAGGGGGDVLPWLKNAGTGFQPGTPGAI